MTVPKICPTLLYDISMGRILVRTPIGKIRLRQKFYSCPQSCEIAFCNCTGLLVRERRFIHVLLWHSNPAAILKSSGCFQLKTHLHDTYPGNKRIGYLGSIIRSIQNFHFIPLANIHLNIRIVQPSTMLDQDARSDTRKYHFTVHL